MQVWLGIEEEAKLQMKLQLILNLDRVWQNLEQSSQPIWIWNPEKIQRKLLPLNHYHDSRLDT